MATLAENVKGVASIDITTDDLSTSVEFYTEVLGGKLLESWSVDIHGEEHSVRNFGKEIDEARANNVDPISFGVPDISENGKYKALWRFIMFDNFIVKLVQYNTTDGKPLSLRDERTAATIIPIPHLCFWLGNVDFNKFIRGVENAAKDRKMKRVFFNRKFQAESDEDRWKVPENELENYIADGGLSPITMVYFKGSGGEQLEIFKIHDPLSGKIQQVQESLGFPNTAFIPGYEHNSTKKRIGITATLFGLNHFGIRVSNMQRSVDFYCNVLGGTLLPIVLDNARGDTTLNMLFQKELLQAKTEGKSREYYGIPDIGDGGSMWLNLRLVQVGSAIVELLEYCTGDEANPRRYNPAFGWTSPAYCNTMTVSFVVQDDVEFQKFLTDIQLDSKAKGFPEFAINKAPKPSNGQLFKGSGIEGYEYAVGKGPSGEHIAFCQFSGPSKKNLHDEIKQYGGVSALFSDLNPLKK